MCRTWLLGVGLILGLAVGTPRVACGQPFKVEHVKKEFSSGDKKTKIRVEHFVPVVNKKLPAIILAPESASFDKVGPVYRAIATRLAEEGFVLLIVHFFDRTGHNGVDPKRIRDQDFLEWMTALGDGIKYARGLPNVDKDRIGLLGFSLGAYLSVAVAADEMIPVKAVASYFGGVPDKLWPKLIQLPPTLVVHGGLDTIVPVAAALRLAGFCQAKGLAHECKIYAAEGHLFEKTLTQFVLMKQGLCLLTGEKFEIGKAIAEALRTDHTIKTAIQTGVVFFNKHLK